MKDNQDFKTRVESDTKLSKLVKFQADNQYMFLKYLEKTNVKANDFYNKSFNDRMDIYQSFATKNKELFKEYDFTKSKSDIERFNPIRANRDTIPFEPPVKKDRNIEITPISESVEINFDKENNKIDTNDDDYDRRR